MPNPDRPGGLVAPGAELTVGAAEAGARLDAFVAAAGLAPSVHGARRLVDEGRVWVDGRRAKKGLRLQSGQLVELRAARARETEAPPALPTLAVLYLDDDLVVVDKPAGLPSVGLRAGESGTAAAAIVARFPECAAAAANPLEGGLGHRLDTGTSGVLIAARNREAWQSLRIALGGGGAEKEYLAEVVGRPARAPDLPTDVAPGAAPGSFTITAPLGRRGRRGAAVRVGAGRTPLPARTEVVFIEERGETALVRARLGRGRPHQIRAHLAHLGCPILGDPLYGPEGARALAEARRTIGFHLHAHRVVLPHPREGRPLALVAAPPPWARLHS